ncbi:MAG: hypothetical protein QX189_04365 [Methylococcales bacterium]
MSEIFPKVQDKYDLIQSLWAEIKVIQGNCAHVGLIGKFRADTGNYCKSDDSYWVEFQCLDCGKQWTEDQAEVSSRYSKEGISYLKVK